ncbi:uncharacterized protein LOC127729725 isoform X1 [Mytilus californianus]|uniref:uncharacterized protein LOC127729725 isoform X1 n=1 Tax=Mytilus californianus TaxID=6549 RepID=UPI0022471BC8|nr:uncharacterized protein LOC127729725 isoform X1 [Mytilus californianus]
MKSGMEYLYYSLSDQLINVIDKYPQEVRDNITNLEISLTIDGLPLFKSSSKSVWPVLCAVHLDPLLIFTVALSYGQTKPANLDFLHDTITDLDNIIQNGLMYSGVNIRIKLRCVVCDAPAKCMVKGIKLYLGYFGCDRCDQRGNWFGRMTYQDTDDLSVRTNDSFRRQTNPEHHNRDSPFCTLDIDMIAQFPIDYMHQCCLGVMKRLILIWIRGKKEVKMSALHSEQISNRLLGLQRFIPREFVRKPRSLCEIDRWKATEYRQFLLYTGKIVLKGILREDLYLHFMTFSVAICILASKSLLQRHHQYANALLKYFVEMGRNLYGPEFIVYNVHSMLHITSDAVKFGSLDAFSAFPFENFMQRIKRMVRSGKNPIVQIAKRLDEIENVKQAAKSVKEANIETKRPNNFYVISDSSCCEVVSTTNIDDGNNRKKLMCRFYERCEPLSDQPCNLGIIGAYKGNDRHSRMKIVSPGILKQKAIMIEKDNGIKIFLGLLHY